MKKYILLLGLSALTFNAYAGCSDGEPNCWDCSKANDATSDCTARLDADGTLNITGSGAMKDYPRINCLTTGCTTTTPWLEYRDNVHKVVIGENITTVGNSAFEDMTSVTDVQLPSTLISIGSVAFEGVKITTIDLPEGLKSIGNAAFWSQPFTSLILPESLEEIGPVAFTQVKKAVVSGGVTNLNPSAFGNHTNWGSWLTKLYCSAKQMEQCRAVAEETGVKPIEYKKTKNGLELLDGKGRTIGEYASVQDLYNNNSVKDYVVNPDDSISVYDKTGKLIDKRYAKIYTIEEIMALTEGKDKFHVRLTYK